MLASRLASTPNIRTMASSPPTTPRPLGRGTRHATRDQHIQVQALLQASQSYATIMRITGLTYSQVEYASRHKIVTPRKRSGRPSLLSEKQVSELLAFVCASKHNRRMAYHKIPQALGWDCKVWSIRHALRKAGFARHPAMEKPPISEATRQNRLEFAPNHQDSTMDRSGTVMWSDESVLTSGKHKRTWVTRRTGEEYDPTCIVEAEERKAG